MGNETEIYKVVIAMGSDSDLVVMRAAKVVLDTFGIESQLRILSAHRTPQEMFDFAKGARDAGIKVIIAGAGGAAHLPGMIAANTSLPVIGVPVALKHLNGLDSLLSIVQMPRGVPVATVAIDNGANAGYLAARILAIEDLQLSAKLDEFSAATRLESLGKDSQLQV